MENPFSWDYLTSVPRSGEIFDLWSTALLVFFAVAELAGFVLYSRPQILWSRRMLRVPSSRRWGSIFLWIASLGFFFFIVRWLQINPFTFGERIWLFVMFLVLLLATVMFALQLRFESNSLAQEHAAAQHARARGIHGRRPPRRSRNARR